MGQLFTKPEIFDTSKMKEFADDNFKFEGNGRMFPKRIENTEEKREMACYAQFLIFPQSFQKAYKNKGLTLYQTTTFWTGPL